MTAQSMVRNETPVCRRSVLTNTSRSSWCSLNQLTQLAARLDAFRFCRASLSVSIFRTLFVGRGVIGSSKSARVSAEDWCVIFFCFSMEKMNPFLKLVTAFLGVFPGTGSYVGVTSCHALHDSHAMNQYGIWSIVRSNDPKVKLLRPPVFVEITPGSFRIPGSVSGSFRLEPELSAQKQGVFVSMCPFSIPMLRETYNVVPLDPDRMALYGTGRHESRYYILERARDFHGVGVDCDAAGGG